MAGLHQAQFPVPRPWALCEDESVVGSKFLVMDFVDGLVIADQNDAAKLLPAEADRACGLLVEGLVELHSLDASAIGLGDFGRPEGYLVRQVRRWGQQWELSKTRELHDINVVAAWLKNRVTQLPQNLPWAIVHGDYRIDNVIINPEITSLRAVLDWEMSTLGDPLADLAISLVYWTQGNDILRQNVPVAQGVTSGPGFWTRQQIVDRYVQLSGLDLSHLGFCLVFACYKIAVIMESLNFRQKSGYQLGKTAELGEDVGLAVESLAQLGVRLLDENTVGTLQT
jgi:aminoglycoside phosphotransferase (APT) family kinase protein